MDLASRTRIAAYSLDNCWGEGGGGGGGFCSSPFVSSRQDTGSPSCWRARVSAFIARTREAKVGARSPILRATITRINSTSVVLNVSSRGRDRDAIAVSVSCGSAAADL